MNATDLNLSFSSSLKLFGESWNINVLISKVLLASFCYLNMLQAIHKIDMAAQTNFQTFFIVRVGGIPFLIYKIIIYLTQFFGLHTELRRQTQKSVLTCQYQCKTNTSVGITSIDIWIDHLPLLSTTSLILLHFAQGFFGRHAAGTDQLQGDQKAKRGSFSSGDILLLTQT